MKSVFKSVLIVSIMLSASFSAQGQYVDTTDFTPGYPIVLRGIVTDKETHDTVPLAIVELLIKSNGSHATRSDFDGGFVLSLCSGRLTNGLLRIQVTVQGYRQEIFEFKVSGDTTLNLELMPDPEGKISEQEVWMKFDDVIETKYDVWGGYEKFRHCDGRIKTYDEIEESGEYWLGWEPYDFNIFNSDYTDYESIQEIPDLAGGSFLHGFYYIDPALIPKLNISGIEFSGKSHGKKMLTKIIHFDAEGKKSKQIIRLMVIRKKNYLIIQLFRIMPVRLIPPGRFSATKTVVWIRLWATLTGKSSRIHTIHCFVLCSRNIC